MLHEAFVDNTMSQSKPFLWYKRFRNGQTSVDDDEHFEQPSTSTTPENIAKVRETNNVVYRAVVHRLLQCLMRFAFR
jgi:hypothetical protein